MMTLDLCSCIAVWSQKVLYVDKVAGRQYGSVVARGPIDQSRVPAIVCVFLTNE